MTTITEWIEAVHINEIPNNGGVCVKLADRQIALYNFKRTGEVFATQNECPHKRQMILSRGMLGDHKGEPKVACPYHKKTFSLKTGECLNDNDCSIETYPVKIENGKVFVEV